jgi:hypothetical protein
MRAFANPTPRSHHLSRNTFTAHTRCTRICAHFASLPTPSSGHRAFCLLLRLPRLREILRSVTKRKFHYGVLQQESECQIPGSISRRLGSIFWNQLTTRSTRRESKKHPHPFSEPERMRYVHQPRRSRMLQLAGTPARHRRK